jgi:chemotaxis protein methyltransferase CheR
LNVKHPAEAGSVLLLETELFAEAAYRRHGVDLRGFDREWLLGRLESLCDQRRAGSISSLQGEILHDAAAAQSAFSYVSENEDGFFTRPTSFMALRCAVLPLLRSVAWPVLWIAECADAAFLTQLMVMLEEEGLLPRTQVFVTNANEDVLGRIADLHLGAPGFQERDAQHAQGGGQTPLADHVVQTETGGYTLHHRLRQHIIYSQHDLSVDASFNECHLVICQRPLSHYSVALRQRALRLFAQSLCNFGILQIDASAGPVSHDLMRDFTCLLGEQGIYKRTPVQPWP